MNRKECASMHINDLVNLFQNLFGGIMTAIRYPSATLTVSLFPPFFIRFVCAHS